MLYVRRGWPSWYNSSQLQIWCSIWNHKVLRQRDYLLHRLLPHLLSACFLDYMRVVRSCPEYSFSLSALNQLFVMKIKSYFCDITRMLLSLFRFRDLMMCRYIPGWYSLGDSFAFCIANENTATGTKINTIQLLRFTALLRLYMHTEAKNQGRMNLFSRLRFATPKSYLHSRFNPLELS